MHTNFLIWGNGSHEFSLNNRNPKSRRLYCNKRDFSTVQVPNKKIEQVFCKDNCLLLIIEGELYKKGYFNWEIEDFENFENKVFQEIKEAEDSLRIKKIESFKDEKNFQVKDIKFGFNHILILSEENNVYSWGDNYYGQLGIKNQMIPMHNSPVRVIFPDNEKIKSVYAFKNNSFAIDVNGGLWGWGKYEYFKQDNSRNVFSPIRILPDDRKVKNLLFMDERVIIEVEDSPKMQEADIALGNTTNLSLLKTSVNVQKDSVYNAPIIGKLFNYKLDFSFCI
jgi:alpha-tubulin suppressor-like RCC1 family protein